MRVSVTEGVQRTRVSTTPSRSSFVVSGVREKVKKPPACLCRSRVAACVVAQTQIPEEKLKKQEYKFFDEAAITIRAGRGGDGEVVAQGTGKYVRNYKYNPGRRAPKVMWLPAGAPADGGDGGDVVLTCDPSLDSLLHFHTKNTYTAKKGPQGNPEEGSQGSKSLSPSKRPKRSAAPCLIPVPPGTVVKRKGSGRYLGELLNPGEQLVVAKGGRGGDGVVVPSRKKTLQRKRRQHQASSEQLFASYDRGLLGECESADSGEGGGLED